MATSGMQIGWIPYLNLHPMHQELMRIAGGQISLLSGHPTTVNRWLCDGTAGLAPCSSINLLRGENLDMAMPLGVASEGPVLSVYLGLQREHANVLEFIYTRQTMLADICRFALATPGVEMRRIAQQILHQAAHLKAPVGLSLPHISFTPASAASVALTKILLRLWFGESLANQMCRADGNCKTPPSASDFVGGNRPIELVIGDEALARRTEFSTIIDLGQAWWELTKLPFVFAVWQTSLPNLSHGVRAILMEAASLSAARMKVEPQVYYPDHHPVDRGGNPIDLAAYWRAIQYKLSPRHLQGLLLYLSMYSEFNGSAENHLLPARIAKWSGQWSRSSQSNQYS